jgi:hypothetical protein
MRACQQLPRRRNWDGTAFKSQELISISVNPGKSRIQECWGAGWRLPISDPCHVQSWLFVLIAVIGRDVVGVVQNNSKQVFLRKLETCFFRNLMAGLPSLHDEQHTVTKATQNAGI